MLIIKNLENLENKAISRIILNRVSMLKTERVILKKTTDYNRIDLSYIAEINQWVAINNYKKLKEQTCSWTLLRLLVDISTYQWKYLQISAGISTNILE